MKRSQVIKYPTLSVGYIFLNVCVGWFTCQQADRRIFLNLHDFDFLLFKILIGLLVRFPSPASGWSRLVSEGVGGRFFSFSISKPQRPRPCKHAPELCPLHLRRTDAHAFMCACRHTHADAHTHLHGGSCKPAYTFIRRGMHIFY